MSNTVKVKAKELQFVTLHSAARRYLKQAKSKSSGYFYDCMTAMLYSAFMIEAYVNEVGDHLYDDWLEKHERKSLPKKLKLIGDKLSTKFNRDKPPYLAITKIMNYRHLAAHSKAQELFEEIPTKIALSPHYSGPRTELDTLATIENAEEHVTNAEEIITAINQHMPDKDNTHPVLHPNENPFILMGIGGNA